MFFMAIKWYIGVNLGPLIVFSPTFVLSPVGDVILLFKKHLALFGLFYLLVFPLLLILLLFQS